MKISHKWLQTYFEQTLPKVEDISRGLTDHSFEIEEVIENNGDYILDVKVLPNRAHDCLSYYGIAKEVSAIFNIPLNKNLLLDYPRELSESKIFSAEIKTSKVKRFKIVSLKNVKVGPSPDWLKDSIESMGGKSINNIVDITNYVMFETGQPMHAFDADLISKNEKLSFIVREAEEGEMVTTLDGVERTLKAGALLITNGVDAGKTILGIAGIKGGMEAGITENTKNILLEAATFDAPTIRRHAKLLNIRTDASVRFENGLAPELPTYAMEYALKLVEGCAKGEDFEIEGEFDFYPRKRNPYKIGASLSEINGVLGTNLTDVEVEKILNRLQFPFEKIENPIEKAIELGKSFLGVPYVIESSVSYDAPNQFDCSSLVTYLYSQVGVSVPRISIDQFVYGFDVERQDLKAGDLVFANTGEGKFRDESIEFLKGTKVPAGVDHVGIMVNKDEILQATRTKGCVVVEKLEESHLFEHIVGLKRILNVNEPRFVVSVPFERLDFIAHTAFGVSGNKEDLIEEIGRMYGLDNIKSVLPKDLSREPEINQEFYLSQKIRSVLMREGFSEVYTYAMVDKGVVEIANPIASDKNFMRDTLQENMQKSLEMNIRNAPLLGKEIVKIFEIGKVFKENTENVNLCLGVITKGKKAPAIQKEILENIKNILKQEVSDKISFGENINESISIADLGSAINAGGVDVVEITGVREADYKKISVYPFMLRDIAVFVPETVSADEVEKVIRDNAGQYLVRLDIFDEFKKEGKVSYAFHLVFQSYDRTLTDDEMVSVMSTVEEAMRAKEWQVR